MRSLPQQDQQIEINPPISGATLAIFLACASGLALADDAALSTITVTATRNPTLLENAPGQVEVVTADEIAKRNAYRASETINALPGVFIQPGRGIMQPSQAVALRGIPDEKRSLVLLDGIPLNDGYAGGLNFGGLPADNIERVEVLYGPMSSLYGGNAMGGVVAMSTRMPKAAEFRLHTGFGNPFESGKGPANVRKTNLSAGNRFDNGLAVLVGGNWASTDGYRTEWVTSTTAPAAGLSGWSVIPQKTGAPTYLLGNKGRTEWDENNLFVKLEQRLAGGERWRFNWMRQAYNYGSDNPQSYLRSATGAPTYGAYAQSLFVNGDGEYQRDIFSLGYDTELLDGLLTLNAGYSNISSNSYITPTGSATGGSGRISDSPSSSRFVDAWWNRGFGAHTLTVGAAYRNDKATNDEYTLSNWTDGDTRTALYATASGRAQTIGIYAQDDWALRHDLTAHLGLRYDHWESSDGSIQTPGWPLASRIFKDYPTRSESAWSPKLAFVWKTLPGLTLRSSLGSAFRAPTVYELYRTTRIVSTTYRANPDLKPETVQTWDVGADITAWQGGEFKLTMFTNRLNDLVYTQGSGTVRNRINLERAESHGLTAGITQRISVSTHLFANATLTDSEVKKNGAAPATEGKLLTFMPKYQANIGGVTQTGAWTLSATARYASKQYSTDDNSDKAKSAFTGYDAYVVAESKLSYRFDKNTALSLAVDNLFDREYFSYYPAPRRTWFAELKLDY
jgi:iron complex outermembrane receptor protein